MGDHRHQPRYAAYRRDLRARRRGGRRGIPRRIALRTGDLGNGPAESGGLRLNGECPSYDPETGLTNCSSEEEGETCRGRPICRAGSGYSGPAGLGSPEGIAAFRAAPTPLREAQTVHITSSPSFPPTVDGPAYEVQAEASSGLPVTFASLSPRAIGAEVCSVVDAVVSFHYRANARSKRGRWATPSTLRPAKCST